jgi:hypothetical protein
LELPQLQGLNKQYNYEEDKPLALLKPLKNLVDKRGERVPEKVSQFDTKGMVLDGECCPSLKGWAIAVQCNIPNRLNRRFGADP